MRRMLGSLNRRALSQTRDRGRLYPEESPEAIILREVKAFCESGSGPNGVADDYLHLPAIVEAAESSPNAAKEAALRIRKYISNPSKPQGFAQYNAIMLIRILSENPGDTFTRNINYKFVTTVKELLREGRDMSAQQLLREMLDTFEAQRSWDENLALLIGMWKKEKERIAKYSRVPPPPSPGAGYGHHHHRRPKVLPPPDELAARITEAKTSASLLIQLSQSTPATEVPTNDLMKEFSERCQAASRSIQGFMNCDNPPPDEDTLLTLIETNDQLSVALSRYQRAILNSRKALSNGSNGSGNGNGSAHSPSPAAPEARNRPLPAPTEAESVTPPPRAPAAPAPSSPPSPPVRTGTNRYEYNPDEFQVQNPFADPDTSRSEHEAVSPLS
ncbi:hypothetical protein VTN77DRAFT_7994 [Rasamsonia byssochlamydoides]|uniref:uncharacterized protein n=1 Tax=Rasamsonia byssochlamydoides TaxID=89139 RepID=UPI0037449D5E